jgi:hypothetical protein
VVLNDELLLLDLDLDACGFELVSFLLLLFFAVRGVGESFICA